MPGEVIHNIVSITGYKNASKNYRNYKSNIRGMVKMKILQPEAMPKNDRKSL
jgi:hypothetical protein